MKFLQEIRAVQGVIAYVRGRLTEKSTFVGIGAAVAGGGVVPAPYSYWVIAFGVIAIFIPEPKK